MPDHRLLGIAGSLSAGSQNRKLMQEAARLYGPAEFMDGDLNLPLYSGDLEDQGLPAEVEALADQLRAADAVIISTPEYNKMIPGVLKNALDWLSRIKGGLWQGKPVGMMSATAGRTGGEVALFTLRHAMAPFRPRLEMAPATMVAGAAKEFDADGHLTNERYVTQLTEQMAALRALAELGRDG